MTGDDPINEIVSNRLVDDFARSSEYTVVERTATFLAELSKEHNYERSGEVNDEQIAALGKQYNVQYVCVVSVLDVWGEEKYITARIIDAETAEVVASCSSNGSIQNKSELIGALNTLSNNFSKALGAIKQNDAKKVAVYVTKTGNRDVDIVLGDQLVSGFARSGRYMAIERTNGFLKKLKEEQGYQQSGAVAEDDLTRLGQQFGVNYVCVVKTTAWSGDYFITTRMVDVKTGEVANSYKVEGRTLSNSQDVVRVAQEIATELSKATFAEREAEARLKAEEEARIIAEQERIRAAEEEAKRKAEEEKQRQIESKKTELQNMLKKGYIVVEVNQQKWMVCIEPLQNVSGKEVKNRNYYSRFGYSDWEIGDWNAFSYELGKAYSVISHYLLITPPICKTNQNYWGFWTCSGNEKKQILTGIQLAYSYSGEFLDGKGSMYYYYSTGKIRDSSPFCDREYTMNNEVANAILVRRIK